MCTVVLRVQPGEGTPLVLLGVRDEFSERAWRGPGRHWGGSPLIGGVDERAGGTWLAVHPEERRVACLLNGRGTLALAGSRRSRGELPLRAAGDGAGGLKDLADDPEALAAYDPFHLVYADAAAAMLLSWDGEAAMLADLPPGTHLLANAGHSYPAEAGHHHRRPAEPVTEPKAVYFGPKFAASSDWLALADGDGLPLDDPRAIVVRHSLPDGRTWGTTSQTLVTLAPGGVRYDFRPVPGEWYQVPA